MFKSKNFWYISLFTILYVIVAFSSFFHAISFFGLANNTWMSIILAFAFEIGQAAVLFSLLTSKKDRSRIMPWVLMFMFTLVQIIGNVFSSYKYIINNSAENLRYFKEPIFIWTNLPDEQATVIIVYIVGAILPIAALLLTSMITNYLSDIDEEKIKKLEQDSKEQTKNEFNEFDNPLINQNSILQMENQGLQEQIDNLKKELEQNKETNQNKIDNNNIDKTKSIETGESQSNHNNETFEDQPKTKSELSKTSEVQNEKNKQSHFINL